MTRPLLVPASAPTDRPLVLVIAVLVAIAVIAGGVTRFTFSATKEWVRGVEASATIEVTPRNGETAVETAQVAAEALLAEPSLVSHVLVYSPSDLADMLEPWFGEDGLPENAPLPGLISVQAETIDSAAMLARLNQRNIVAEIDLLSVWSDDVKRAGFVLRAIAAFSLVLLCLGGIFVVVFATRASLSARQNIVEVLHTVGARDGFIAGQFTRRFIALGLRGGLLGALIGVAVGALAAWGLNAVQSLQPFDLVPRYQPRYIDGVIVALAPLVTTGIAAAIARFTVLASLKDRY
jgi:cell division transport system permease protein